MKGMIDNPQFVSNLQRRLFPMNLPCILQKTEEHSDFKGHQAEKNLLSHHIHTQIKSIPLECTELDSATFIQTKLAEI